MTRSRLGRTTVLRRALREDSSLQSAVCDGLGAIQTAHRDYFDEHIRETFADSIDVDEAMRPGREQEHRWDYLLGHGPSSELVAVEPHSAKHDEISTIIRKKEAAREYLRFHLRNGFDVHRWLWVASGNVYFADTEKAAIRLAHNGIKFVGKRVMAKHLGSATAPTASRGRRRRR